MQGDFDARVRTNQQERASKLQIRFDYIVCGAGTSGCLAKLYPPAPLGGARRPDAGGFLSVSPKGIAEDFAQDLSDKEKQRLTATRPTNGAAFGATITTAAWKTKPSWFAVASQGRAIPPELEKAEASAMKAT